MKQRMQGMVMGVLVMTLLFGTVTVFAATPQTIEVFFGNIRTTVHGLEFVVRDDEGEIIEPFFYNGRAYVPVETILNAMRQNVQWDEATTTLNFGTPEQIAIVRKKISLNSAAPFFDSGAQAIVAGVNGISVSPEMRSTVVMGGITYQDALVHGGWGDRQTSFTLHNLNGQFKGLSGYIGRVDQTVMRDAVVRFIGDDNLLQSLNVTAGNLPIPFVVNVKNVNLLRIEVELGSRLPGGGTVEYAIIAFLE